MKKYCLAFCFIVVACSLHADPAQIYKWTDSSGNVHFSDKPHEGAEQIELPKVQTYSSPKATPPAAPSDEVVNEEGGVYESLTIVQPEEQATIRNPQGYLSIVLDVKPTLRKGDKLQIIFDGIPLGMPQEATTFALQNIKRGSHTIVAQVVDNQGTVLNTSQQVNINMMPPRVGMVPGKGNNGNNANNANSPNRNRTP